MEGVQELLLSTSSPAVEESRFLHFLFFHTNRYEAFLTATSVSSASEVKENLVSIRNQTQMKQALSFLLSVLVIFLFKD